MGALVLASFVFAAQALAGPRGFKQVAPKHKHVTDLPRVGRGLPVGSRAPDFSLLSGTGKRVRLADALARGPVVLVFFRGHW